MRLAFSLAVTALFLFASGCSDPASGPTHSPPQVTGASFSMLQDISDDCGNGFYSCHFDDMSYADAYWMCPSGCHTFPLNPSIKSIVYDAMQKINRTACPWAYNYINQALTSGRIRYYNQDDGNFGDIHYSLSGILPGPDNRAVIHLSAPMIGTNQFEMALTLVHEAYHGYYNSHDEVAAEDAAESCVNG